MSSCFAADTIGPEKEPRQKPDAPDASSPSHAQQGFRGRRDGRRGVESGIGVESSSASGALVSRRHDAPRLRVVQGVLAQQVELLGA
jgi:hypothetical protein